MSQINLNGIIPAIVNPMDEKYNIVEDDLINYVKWISRFRIAGLAVNVDTGEGPSLTDEEREFVISKVASIVKGKITIVAGVPPSSTTKAAEIARSNRKAGADALLVFPHPYFYGHPLPPELPYHYHKAIADASNLPVILFQLQPALGGYEFTEETLLRLIEIPSVIAIKEALFDAYKFYNTLRILRKAQRRITLLTGNDNFIAESLILGADGALIGFGTLATAEQVEMFELIKKKRYDEALEIWEKLIPLMEVIFKPPVRDYRARIKVALALQGIIENVYVRPPLRQISQQEVNEIRQALIKSGLPIEQKKIEIT